MEDEAKAIVMQWWDWFKKSAFLLGVISAVAFVRVNYFGSEMTLELPSYAHAEQQTFIKRK